MSRAKADRIDIPPSAFDMKADFPTLESALGVRDEAREWIKSGQPLYEWPFHTHLGPTQDESEEVEFIHDFTLPAKTPCPCCRPWHPQFKRGFLAWFGKTQVIRFIGQDCFRRMNPDAFRAANTRREERSSREATVKVLSQNIPLVQATIKQLEGLLDQAAHLDELQVALGKRLDERRKIDLWRLLRDGGQLKLVESYTEVVNGRIQQRETFTTYSHALGYRLIDPKRKKIAPRLRAAIDHLRAIPASAGFDSLEWNEKAKAHGSLILGKKLAASAIEDMKDCRRFVGVQTVNTIKAWGKLPNAAARIHMRLEGLNLYIGYTEQDATYPIKLSQELDKNIPVLEI